MPDDQAVWPTAVNAALLGTDRAGSAMPDVAGPLGAALATLPRTEGDAAGHLLRVAAATAVYRRCGWVPPRVEAGALAPCPAEDRPLCSPAAATALRRMLHGEHASVIGEWLALAVRHGVRAPADSLPELLEHGRREASVHALVVQAAGARGAWLGALNPDWSYVSADGTADALVATWETGATAARVAALQRLRRLDTDRARALLEASWAQENPAERAAFVGALATGLTAADEPFLERALDDRRKEVRQRAAALLATLPSSALVARMTGRTANLLSSGRSAILRRLEITVALPAAPDAALVRDGIEAKPAAGIGERAWWLAQMLAAVPPSTWSSAWGVDPAAVVRAIDAHEWREPLLAGWLTATDRFRDIAWAEALWQNERIARIDGRWGAPSPERVFVTVVPADRVDTELRTAIAAGRDALRGTTAVLAALLEWPHPWSDALARAVARRVREYAGDAGIVLAAEFGLRALLQRCAHAVPVLASSAFTDPWPERATSEPVWSNTLDALASILQFRHDVHLAFNESSPT